VPQVYQNDVSKQELEDVLIDTPCAKHTFWFICDHCPHLHAVFQDSRGGITYQAILDRQMVESMWNCVKGH
jgi:hypothetical protein